MKKEGLSTLAACIAAITCAATVHAAEPWTTFQGNAQHTGHVPMSLNPQSFAHMWDRTITGAGTLNPVTAADGKVFVTSNASDSLYTLNAANGDSMWSKNYPGVHSVNPPAYAYGNVYIQTGNHGSDTYIRAYEADTGNFVFRTPHSAQWDDYYAPTIDNGKVFVNGGYFGGMYSFDAHTGGQDWFHDLPGYDDWTPAVDDNYAYSYVGENNPALYVLNRETGAEAYRIDDPNFDWTGWSMNLAPVLGGMDDALAIHDGRLISFDLDQRDIRYEIDSNFTGQLSVADGVIYAIDGGALVARDQTTGAHLWGWEDPADNLIGTLIVTDSHIFTRTGDEVFAIDLLTHQSVWSYQASGHLALSDDVLYIAGTGGLLTAVAVPEPSTLFLVALATCALVRRKQKRNAQPLITALLAIASAAVPAYSQHLFELRHVALSGDAAPEGGTLSSFGRPVINDLGQVAFTSQVTGTSPANERLYLDEPFGLNLIAQTGVDLPGLPAGVHVDSFGRIVPNAAGQVAFSAYLSGAGVTSGNGSAAALYDGGSLSFQLRAGDTVSNAPTPGTAGSIYSVRLSGNYIGVRTRLSPSSIDTILTGTPGNLSAAIQVGMPAPGHQNGTVIQALTVGGSNWLYQLNDSGDIGLRATVQLPSGSRPMAIYRTDAGSLQLVAKVGDSAPTSMPGTTFSGFGEPSMNNSGVSAFYAVTQGTTGPSPQGIWAGKPGGLRNVVDPGQAHPDLPAGQYFSHFPGWNPVINDSSDVAFAAFVNGTGVTSQNNGTLWAEIDGTVELIAREGDTPPGMSENITFSSFVAQPEWSDAGQMSFLSYLRGPGLGVDNNDTLWLTDEEGTPILIAWEGHDFDLGGGDIRIIDTIDGWVNQGSNNFGRGTGLNDFGELTFGLTFRDGTSGVFVARIPEPQMFGALILAAACTIRLNRRCSTNEGKRPSSRTL